MIAQLVDTHAPGLCLKFVTMDPSERLKKAQYAMGLAEQWLGVPQVLLPGNIKCYNVDELSVNYLFGFTKAQLKPGAPIKPQLVLIK